MWGETPPRTADKTLQSYVTRLRKGLGSESIVRAGAAYRLDLPGEAVDVVRFRKHLDGGNVEAALAESAALSTISPAAVAELHRMDEPYLAALIELAGVASGLQVVVAGLEVLGYWGPVLGSTRRRSLLQCVKHQPWKFPQPL